MSLSYCIIKPLQRLTRLCAPKHVEGEIETHTRTHTHTEREIERVVRRFKNIYYNHIFHYVTTLDFCSVVILLCIIYL